MRVCLTRKVVNVETCYVSFDEGDPMLDVDNPGALAVEFVTEGIERPKVESHPVKTGEWEVFYVAE